MKNDTIYTEKAECQDCYKCVRECPVKAIKIENNHAQVIVDDCILCGHCIGVCPVGAKKVRSDILKVESLLETSEKVIVSLAPSFFSEYKDIKDSQIIRGLKQLGFYAVSETALGAQEVSATVACRIRQGSKEMMISSACPTIVLYIKKYFPEYANCITDYYSPLMVHAKLLKEEFGEDCKIVFIGPCISKKHESDHNRDLIDASISFNDLEYWLKMKQIDLASLPAGPEERFLPEESTEGRLYPIEGGMINTIKANCNYTEANYMTFSGISNIKKILNKLDMVKYDNFLFLELLACEGGCINGPATSQDENTIMKRLHIINSSKAAPAKFPGKPVMNIKTDYNFKPILKQNFTFAAINKKLESIGKYSAKDELNCGGCGYDSCRDFVVALIEEKAEKSMCVSYMRKLAQKKTNALINTMPSGVVIVNNRGTIEECNKKFAELIGEEAEFLFSMIPGLEGAELTKIFPEHASLFLNALENDSKTFTKAIKYSDKILNLSVFPIESRTVVGGILQDITEPSVRKEHIVHNAKDVIKKNIVTVQKIAYLLGENAAESEVLLNSIIDAYSKESS